MAYDTRIYSSHLVFEVDDHTPSVGTYEVVTNDHAFSGAYTT